MKLLGTYLLGAVKILLPSAVIFFIILFMAKDVYMTGIEAKKILMYKPVLLILLTGYASLELLLFLLGAFLLIYQNKKEELLGWCLGAVIIVCYLIRFFTLYLHYWD